jgi:hypothetical protein
VTRLHSATAGSWLRHEELHRNILLLTMMKLILLAVVAGLASAYVAPKTFVSRRSTQLHENFGLGVGEDSYKATADLLKGEANYKQWVNRIDENSFLNRQVSVSREIFAGEAQCFSEAYLTLHFSISIMSTVQRNWSRP